MQAACSMEHVPLWMQQDEAEEYHAAPFWSSGEDCMLRVRLHFQSSSAFCCVRRPELRELVPMIPRLLGFPRLIQELRPMFCESALKSGWDAPWYCLRISLVPRPVMWPVAKRPIVSDPFKQASRIAK